MKKFYTLLLGAALPLMALADGKPVPYESQFYQDSEWIVYNNNNDEKTWEDNSTPSDFAGSGYTVGKMYRYSSTEAADDWLVGPAIHLEAGKDYKVKFWFKTQGSDDETITLYMGTSGSTDDLLNATVLYKLENFKDTSGAYHAKTFTVATTGDYYFGFHLTSPKYKYNPKITGFQVREDVFAPGAPTGLTVTPGADRALSATLSWALPTTDVDGAPMPDGAIFDEIRVLRDGVQLITPNLLPTATEFVDDDSFGLTSGVHTYQVICVVNGAASPAATVTSKYIGPVAPLAVPFDALTTTFDDKDNYELFWSTDKGQASDATKEWSYYKSTWNNDTYLSYYPGYYSSTPMDEWLISPALAFTEAGVYKVSIITAFANPGTVEFYLGNGTTLGSYGDNEKIGEVTVERFAQGTPLTAFFNIDAPCQKQIAMHISTPTNSSSTFYFYNMMVEAWHISPAQIDDLAANISGDDVVLTWTNPSKANTGAPLSAITKNVVYFNGEVLETLTDNVTPGQAVTYTHQSPDPGVHTYYVETYLNETVADGTPMSVTTKWVGDETQPVKYQTYFARDDKTRVLWKSVDGNNDGLTFVMPAEGVTGKPTLKKVTDYTNHDDYLVSPYMNLDKAGYYKLTVQFSGGAYSYKMELGKITDKDDIAGTYSKIGEAMDLNGNYSAITYSRELQIDAPTRMAFAAHTQSTANPATSSDRDIAVESFTIEYMPLTPNKPEKLTATAAPDSELKTILTWTNPTESNIEGIAPVIAKAVISRKKGSGSYGDFTEVATIEEGLTAGEPFTWTDETLTEPGIYTYKVMLHGTEDYDPSSYLTATTTWVGPGISLPVSVNMVTTGDNPDPVFDSSTWTIHNVNGDTSSWGDITWEVNSTGARVGITSNKETTDDWAIHGFYQFDKGDEYLFTIANSTDQEPTTVWELWLGTSNHYDDMYTKVADITTPETKYEIETHSFRLVVTDEDTATPDAQADGDEPELPIVYVRPGATSIGLHLNSGGQVTFRGFSFEVVKRAVSSVTLDKTELELHVDGTETLTATVNPDDATDKTVTWTSSDETVATVDAEGNVTAVGIGEAEITATAAGVSAVCTVSVTPVLAESITISETATELTEGETLQLTAEVAPENVTDATVTWTSSDEAVATVDATGLVTAVAPGEATVTAACGDVTAECAVTVVARVIPVDGITLSETSIFGAPGNSQQLTATVTPDDATDKTVTWTSSDETVATVDADGLVTFVADGEADITATCGEFSATCHVLVMSSGLALIPADMRNEARVYTLQGVEVKAENLTEGFYIVVFTRDGQRVSAKIRL